MATKEIKELTPEQIAKLDVYANKWIQKGISNEFPSEDRVLEIVSAFYKNAGCEVPPLHIVDSPSDAVKLAKELGAQSDDIQFAWMHHDAGSIGFYEFFQKETDLEELEDVDMFVDGAELGWTLFFDEHCIVSRKPTVYFELPHDQIRAGTVSPLHRMDGPAIDFGPGNLSNVYAVRGVRVDAYVIEEPEKITVEDIESESNAEVRRVKIDQYGQSRYLMDSGAKEIHSDDFGTLYRKEIPGDEPLMMVKVVNSSMEPDGTFKDYFLRVDPNAYGGLKTALAAVASTWRNEDGTMMFEDPAEYRETLAVET